MITQLIVNKIYLSLGTSIVLKIDCSLIDDLMLDFINFSQTSGEFTK